MELEPWLEAEPGRKGVIDVEDWAEIRRLHRAEGLSIKAISRRLGVARNTVRDSPRRDEPPRYERAPSGSVVDAVEPLIRELLAEFPTMPATVIAERIGWERGITILRDRVAEQLKALHRGAVRRSITAVEAAIPLGPQDRADSR